MLGKSVFNKTLGIIGFLILVFMCQVKGVVDTMYLCLSPIDSNWWRVFTAPLLHASMEHLVGNIIGMIVAVPVILSIYDYASTRVLIAGYVLPMVFVCMMGVRGYSLGFSGAVYCYIWFVIIMGLRSKTTIRFIAAIIFLLFYGSTLIGATPLVPMGVSWEAHLGGVITALICAVFIKEEG